MIETVVVKVAAPCNLACTYCYEYETGDDSWKSLPKHIDIATVISLAERIREYAAANNLSRFNVTLHGGEPLLLGHRRLRDAIARLREAAAPVDLRVGLQTNGVLITDEMIDVFREHRVRVGISLDGNAYHNRRRLDLMGRPTFERAVAGYERMQARCPECLAGLLTVIDLDNPAAETIRFLCGLKPRQLDLLLPFVTHDGLGDGRVAWGERLDEWLRVAFDTWFHDPQLNPVKVRILEDVMQAVITRQAKTDWFGPRGVSYLVVATDGHIDILDHLKVIGDKSEFFRATSANVRTHSLLEAELLAAGLLAQYGATRLPADCKGCFIADVCAGGYLPHRYSAAAMFDNPSVACTAIQGMFRRALPIVTTARFAQPKPETLTLPCP